MDYQQFITSEKDMIIQNLISVWVDLLDARNLESKAHTERVCQLSIQFAARLGLDEEEKKKVYFGSQLHDIGKLGVQDSVLLKNEKLTVQEFTTVKNHPLFAKQMIEDSPYLSSFSGIPFSHHERWDGTGYPEGRKEEAIPVEARLFALVDTWDALTNDRPFQKALTREQAIIILRQSSGTQFDPEMTEQFIAMLLEKETGSEDKPIILVVDDEPYLRLALKDLFTREGFDCRVAGSGKEGLNLLGSATPALIISDIMMPSMNGFDFRKAVQLISEELADIPFIFLTAKTTQQDKIEGYELNADDYITKPFEPMDLLLKVKAILHRSQKIKRQEQSLYSRQFHDLTHVITRNTTHELKSPLGIIIGNLEVVMRKFNKIDDPLIAPCLEDAQSSARRLQIVIDELLYLYKIDNQIASDEMVKINVDRDILFPINQVVNTWTTKNLDVHLDIAQDLEFVVPIDGFSYSLHHLVDNACKFAPENGKVWVMLHEEGKYIVLTVENNGQRIPAALREKVFERFFQVSNGDNRDSSGLGLGLAIASNFADACGGKIEILDSKVGSKIRLQVPHIKTTESQKNLIPIVALE
jgi:response regulator RpfG family c-di-GMP phosphodiesterase